MIEDALHRAFRWMKEIACELELPGLVEGTFMGHPSLELRGKSVIGSKDGVSLVIHCPIEEKETLLEAAPDIYFETDHYKGCPAVLVRPDLIGKRELARRIEGAWAMNASKRQLKARG